MRLETTGPAIWFKAVGEPNLQELAITLKLAELFPTFLAEIVGKKPEWNAWLSREVEGTSLGDTKDLTSWERAASDLARLQIDSISRTHAILDSGSHDLRAIKLLTSVNPFFELAAELMEEQPKVHPPALSRPELNLLQLQVKNSLTLLDSLRIPNTLGHLDLNPWNVVVSGDRCVFLDWAEAYVGHPFLSFQYLLEHFRRAVGPNVTAESNFVSAYKGPWHQLLSEDLTSEALALAPLVAVFAHMQQEQERGKIGEAARSTSDGLLSQFGEEDEPGSYPLDGAEGGMRKTITSPPYTAMEDITEILHGVTITDSYRWLEDQESQRTREWLRAQREYARAT